MAAGRRISSKDILGLAQCVQSLIVYWLCLVLVLTADEHESDLDADKFNFTLKDILVPDKSKSDYLNFDFNAFWSHNESYYLSKLDDFDVFSFQDIHGNDFDTTTEKHPWKNSNSKNAGMNSHDPIFDNNLVTNVTVQLGETAFLRCRVRNLGERPVSWVRRRDWHILTSGMFTYTNDERFQVAHTEGGDDWNLQIKYVQKRDNGTYECQVATGKGTISHYYNLHVVVPSAFILGSGEYHIGEGSTISLVCIIENSPSPPQYVFWYHNERMINYDTTRGGVTVSTEPGPKTHSRLIINSATTSDSGNYTCRASNTEADTIYVFVSKGNISVLTFGLQAGWLSPLQPSLQSEDSPLGIPPLTVEQISWIGSLPSVSLILASPLFGFCLNRYGRKFTCLITTAPNLIHYALLFIANDVYIIYLARLIGGFCSCGGFITAPIYINETSEPHLKGLLGGLTGFIIKVGIILSFIFGGYTSYLTLNLVSVSFTILFLFLYFWLPESPVYLVTVNKREEAKKVLKKLRGPNEKLIEKELDDIEHMIIESHKNNEGFSMKDFFTSRATVKGLLIVCGVYTFQMMCGYPAIVRYAVDIFQNSASVFSPNLAAILVAVSQLLSSFVGASLIDKLGRKSILMLSTFFMSVMLIIFSSYMLGRTYFENSEYSSAFKFIPTITLILYICSYASGYGSVPFVILPELFAPEARAKAASVSNIWISFIEFLVVKMFPTFSYWIGLAPTLLIFAGHCVVGLVFYKMVMFETKGLDCQTIYRILNGNKGKAKVLENEMLKPLSSDNDLEKQVPEYKSGVMA